MITEPGGKNELLGIQYQPAGGMPAEEWFAVN
jgi:hypothetical protein